MARRSRVTWVVPAVALALWWWAPRDAVVTEVRWSQALPVEEPTCLPDAPPPRRFVLPTSRPDDGFEARDTATPPEAPTPVSCPVSGAFDEATDHVTVVVENVEDDHVTFVLGTVQDGEMTFEAPPGFTGKARVQAHGWLDMQVDFDAAGCTLSPALRKPTVSGWVLTDGELAQGPLEVAGCGGYADVDPDGGFFVEVEPGPCTLVARRRDKGGTVIGAAVELDPWPGDDLIVDLTIP